MKSGTIDSGAGPVGTAVERLGKRQILISATIGMLGFLFYRFLLDYYYLGDPLNYQRFYDAAHGMSLASALIYQQNYLGSSELVYPFIAWLGSNSGIERNLLMAVFDGVMYALLFAALAKYRCHPVFIALCLTNFYTIVLATSAERLKFSYILFFLAMIASGRSRLLAMALTPLAHFQSVITLGAIATWTFFSRFSVKAKFAIAVGSAVVGSILFYYFSDQIIIKFLYYLKGNEDGSIIPALIILAISLLIFEHKVKVIATITPLIMVTFLLGGSRLNMITVTVFLYLAITERKTSNPLVLALLIYFFYKSIFFVQDVILYGTGYT